MPEGLLDSFTKEEILDLLAYIESSGKEKANNFKSVEAAKRSAAFCYPGAREDSSRGPLFPQAMS